MINKRKSLKRVILQGPYPPSYGGVSIYTYRLSHWLRANGIDCQVYAYNYKSENEYPTFVHGPIQRLDWLRFCLPWYTNILHFQTSGLPPAFGKGVKLMKYFGKKIVLTMHSLHADVNTLKTNEKDRYEKTLNQADAIIVVGPHLREKLSDGFDKLPPIFVISGFLKPLDFETDERKLSSCASEFIETHHPILSTNVSVLKRFEGEDLYGIDICVNLVSHLVNKFPQLGLYVAVPIIEDHQLFKNIRDRIIELKIGKNIYFEKQQRSFLPALAKSDLFLRLTASDGAAISLAEALLLGVESIASDVCPRLKAATICNRNDLEKLSFLVEQILKGKNDRVKIDDENLNAELNLKKLTDVYHSVISK